MKQAAPFPAFVLATLVLAFALAVPLAAADAPMPPPDTAKSPTDPALEKRYADEMQRKVEIHTARADESLSSLFKGICAVFGAVALMGVWALLRTGKQQRELDRLKADSAPKS